MAIDFKIAPHPIFKNRMCPDLKMDKSVKKIIAQAVKRSKNVKFQCFKMGCNRNAINSHSQSLSNALKKIAQRGHVIKVRPPLPLEKDTSIDACFKKIGIRNASTFVGFCFKHDNEYFKSVDLLDASHITKEELTKLAFRAFSYEERTKEKWLVFLEHCIANGDIFNDISMMEAHTEGIRNHLSVTKPHYLSRFNEIFESRNYEKINGLIFLLKKMLPISCSSTIDPTLLGSSNVTEGDLSKPLNSVFFNIIPQHNSTLAIFSFFDEQREMLKNFIIHFNTLENIIFNHCEEVLLNPRYYNSLDMNEKLRIINGLRHWTSWEKEEIPSIFGINLDSPIFI